VKQVWIAMLVFGLAGATTIDTVIAQGKAQVAEEQASQQKVARLDDETKALARRYRSVLEEQDRIRVFNAQLQKMTASQAEEIASLQQQIDEAEATNQELVPMMQQMIATLEQFVSIDTPFRSGERQRRIAGLKAAMDDAAIGISEKYRRIAEAYKIEHDYARTIEAYREQVALPEGERTVDLLRVGRVGLYYRTLDGETAGMWRNDERRWVPLDEAQKRTVKAALLIARKQAAPDLFVLPVVKEGSR